PRSGRDLGAVPRHPEFWRQDRPLAAILGRPRLGAPGRGALRLAAGTRGAPRMSAIRNALTVDVEDYFQVSAFEHAIDRASWPSLPCRVERNMERILCLLAEADVHATFFTLGWIAERYPSMVRAIVAAGHELASHGYAHWRASAQTRAQFAYDISLS